MQFMGALSKKWHLPNANAPPKLLWQIELEAWHLVFFTTLTLTSKILLIIFLELGNYQTI